MTAIGRFYQEITPVLTDFALQNLNPRATLYSVADRDGMHAVASPKGTISFRYDYRINSRRETLTIGRYGFGGSVAFLCGRFQVCRAVVPQR
ncbi:MULTISPECIES: Arm DNA-binding domain-containing protein [Paraburkholderia]|uniref:Arm DNA-binding domain-containing protein n=1 Tax=Paraburkholderia TaxID=1822464 RepID=UPI0038B9948F